MRQLAVAAISAAGLTAVSLPFVPAAGAAADVWQNEIASANPVDWTPQVTGGTVKAYAVLGGKVVVGGDFTAVREPGVRTIALRRNIFAFDIGTGRVDPNFAPEVNGTVETLAASTKGTSVFAGGSFTRVNRAKTRGLTKLALATGKQVSGFKAAIDKGRVRQLVRRGPRLYAGGSFTAIRGVPRTGLARLSAKRGSVDRRFDFALTNLRRGRLQVMGMAVNRADSRLVVDGSFTRVDGKRRSQIAMINTRQRTLRNWSTRRYGNGCGSSWDSYMRDVEFSPDGSYFVVVTTGGWHKGKYLCDSAARWETRPNRPRQEPTWVNWTGGDSLFSVAVTGAAVYVGGHQRWLNNPQGNDKPGPGAVSRPGLGALNPTTGMALDWNPTRKPLGYGTETILADPKAGLLTGSDTNNCGDEEHAKICAFPSS